MYFSFDFDSFTPASCEPLISAVSSQTARQPGELAVMAERGKGDPSQCLKSENYLQSWAALYLCPSSCQLFLLISAAVT